MTVGMTENRLISQNLPRGWSPGLCVSRFKNNKWILKLRGSFDNMR